MSRLALPVPITCVNHGRREGTVPIVGGTRMSSSSILPQRSLSRARSGIQTPRVGSRRTAPKSWWWWRCCSNDSKDTCLCIFGIVAVFTVIPLAIQTFANGQDLFWVSGLYNATAVENATSLEENPKSEAAVRSALGANSPTPAVLATPEFAYGGT